MNDLVNDSTAMFIFPNPASDQLAIWISSQSYQMIVLQLFNSLGQAVRKEIVNAHAGENYFFIPTSDLSEGNYLLLNSGNKFSKINKVIIQH